MSNAKDLITLARAYNQLPSQYASANDTLMAALITEASDAIEKYCHRDFYSKSYDELYNGNGERRLLLREYPVTSVQSVRYRPVTVLMVTNTIAANVQARVTCTGTGLTLVRVNAGVKTTDTSVAYAGNVTLTAMAAAVNALGSGWSAQIVGDSINYGGWPSADLYWPPSYPSVSAGTSGQGALSCVAGSYAELKMHTYELQGFQWDPRGWLLRAIPYTDPELLHPEDLVFPTGINNFRIQYTAGYSVIPEAVQQACAIWCSQLWFMTYRDPMLVHQVPSGGTASGYGGRVALEGPGGNVIQSLLAPYRRHTISTGQS